MTSAEGSLPTRNGSRNLIRLNRPDLALLHLPVSVRSSALVEQAGLRHTAELRAPADERAGTAGVLAQHDSVLR